MHRVIFPILREEENLGEKQLISELSKSSIAMSVGNKNVVSQKPVILQPFLHPELVDTNPCEIILRLSTAILRVHSFNLIANARALNVLCAEGGLTLQGERIRNYQVFESNRQSLKGKEKGKSSESEKTKEQSGISIQGRDKYFQFNFDFPHDQTSQQLHLVVCCLIDFRLLLKMQSKHPIFTEPVSFQEHIIFSLSFSIFYEFYRFLLHFINKNIS